MSINSFIFNSEIDPEYINSLYGEDFVYMQEVFETVLNDYKSLSDNIENSFSSGDLPSLKKAVHKMKPVFGFVGMTAIQQDCQQFESHCGQAGSLESLAVDFTRLQNRLDRGRQIIEEEKKKLELYNSNRA